MDVVAEVRLRDLHPRKLGLVLVQVVDRVVPDRRLDGDRRERIGALRIDLTRELSRCDVEHARQPPDLCVPALLRHVADPELHRCSRDVRDDDVPVAVEDRPTRRIDAHEAELVVLSCVEVARPRQHLQRPEPEEEHRESHERNRAEDAHAQRELRGEPVRLAHARVVREEAVRRVPLLAIRPARQAPRPRTAAVRNSRGRRAGARERRPGARARDSGAARERAS